MTNLPKYAAGFSDEVHVTNMAKLSSDMRILLWTAYSMEREKLMSLLLKMCFMLKGYMESNHYPPNILLFRSIFGNTIWN